MLSASCNTILMLIPEASSGNIIAQLMNQPFYLRTFIFRSKKHSNLKSPIGPSPWFPSHLLFSLVLRHPTLVKWAFLLLPVQANLIPISGPLQWLFSYLECSLPKAQSLSSLFKLSPLQRDSTTHVANFF